MNDSLLMVEKRIKEAVSSYNSIMLIKEDGPLIEPSRCEIVNECHLSIEMVSAYEQHITHMKNSFLKTASFIKIYLNSIGIFGDIFEISPYFFKFTNFRRLTQNFYNNPSMYRICLSNIFRERLQRYLYQLRRDHSICFSC